MQQGEMQDSLNGSRGRAVTFTQKLKSINDIISTSKFRKRTRWYSSRLK